MTLRRRFNGAKTYTEARDDIEDIVVGERCVWGEAVAEAAVDYTQVRMPE